MSGDVMSLADNNSVRTEYPVNMIPFSKKAIALLREEIIFEETVSKKNWVNIPSAFDTETTSFIDDRGDKAALCYIWMFGIGDTVVYGRELDEFRDLCDGINDYLKASNKRLITYVHFFKFDFSFIKFVLHWDHVFLKENRDVLYAIIGNMEFRDSLVLSGGQSLERIGKGLHSPVRKAKGDLDYNLIRHTKTPLTQRELHYCEMDIRVLCEYIREKIQDDGDISRIPYTNTGYVRNYVRNECFKDRYHYSRFIGGLTMTPDCYMQAESAFTGGSVSPNIGYVDKVCSYVHSYDIKSSYPYVMCTGYYPTCYFTPVSNDTTLYVQSEYLKAYCCLFTLELWDIEPTTTYYFPISKHKCIDIVGGVIDSDDVEGASGRVISGMYLKINCTELDLDTFKKFYKWSDMRITHMRIAPRGYLPDPIIKSVLKFFFDKTTLDGVVGYEKAYMIAKNMLNAVYGMMVEKPVRPVFGFVNDIGFTKDDPDFVEAIDGYNEKFNRFLFYPWGVWVTAHARWRLHDAIYNVGPDFRYCDTDSVKFVGDHESYFRHANIEAENEMRKLAIRLNMPIEKVVPVAPDGSRKILGVWEHEYDAWKFKTLGAKRYLVDYSWTEKGDKHYKRGEKLELTVAGTNKDSTLEYLKLKADETGKDIFDLFNTSLVIPEEYAKRTVSTFIDTERTGFLTDYLGNRAYYQAPSGLHVAPTTYSFSITEEMKNAIEWACHGGHWQDGQL